MAVDPYSYAVSLQIRGEGTDGLLDSGPLRLRNLESATRAVKSTSVKKYGEAAVGFDGNYVIGGTIDYIRFGSSISLSLGTSDFTLRLWVNPAATSETDPIVVANSGSWNSNSWKLCADHASAANKYSFWVNNSSSTVPLLVSTSNVVYGEFVHIEVTRSGNAFRMMVNGVVEATGTFSGDVSSSPNPDSIFIGFKCPCYIDDFQLTKGVARHTADFTPPTAEPEIDPISLASIGANIQAAGLPSGQYSTKMIGDNIRVRDEYFGGDGRVRGTVKLKNTPTNTPLARRVYLMRDEDMKVIRTGYSNATTGEYEFTWIDKAKKYTVLSVDYEHTLRAVVADNLTAEAMP